MKSYASPKPVTDIRENCSNHTLQKLPSTSSVTGFVSQNDVNEHVKYRKRISTEVIEVCRIHHELIPYNNNDEFVPGSRELVAYHDYSNFLQTKFVSENAKPPGKITLRGNAVITFPKRERRNSLYGAILNRWK